MAKNNFNWYLFLFFIIIILVINFPILIPIMIVIFLIFKKWREEQRQKFLKFFGIKSIEELNYFYKKGNDKKNIKNNYYKKNKNNYSKNSNLNRNKIEKEIIEALVKNEKNPYKVNLWVRLTKIYEENGIYDWKLKTELYNFAYDEFLKLSNYQKNKILWIDTTKKDKNNNFTIIPEKKSRKEKTKIKYKSTYKVHHYNTKFKSIWDDYESVIDTMWKK